MHKENLLCEDMNFSRRMQGKRALAVLDTCKIELRRELQRLFIVFDEALKKADVIINQIPPHSRGRGFEPVVMQSCFMDKLLNEFENNAFFGKYKRIILRKKGYLILFKKLNGKGYPMNIKTQNVQSILNQNQVLDLFSGTDYNDEPILYFGYQKNRHGEFINPQLVYIDDGEIIFNITREDIQSNIIIEKMNEKSTGKAITPTLKKGLNRKKG